VSSSYRTRHRGMLTTCRGCLEREPNRRFLAAKRACPVAVTRDTRPRLEGAAGFIGPPGIGRARKSGEGERAQRTNQPIGPRERVWEICTRTESQQCTSKRATRREGRRERVGGEARKGSDSRRGIRESPYPRIRDNTHPRGSSLPALTSLLSSPLLSSPLLSSPPPSSSCLSALCSIRQALLIFPRAPGVIRARSASFALSTSVSPWSPQGRGGRGRDERKKGATRPSCTMRQSATVTRTTTTTTIRRRRRRRRRRCCCCCCIRVHRSRPTRLPAVTRPWIRGRGRGGGWGGCLESRWSVVGDASRGGLLLARGRARANRARFSHRKRGRGGGERWTGGWRKDFRA